MKKSILFVGHEASRTGAPIVLGHLLRWLKGKGDIDIFILLKKDGELEADFKLLGPVWTWSPGMARDDFWGRLQAKLSRKLLKKSLYKPYPRELKNKKFDLIYLNTVASTDMLPELKRYHDCPVILHVHENEFSIKTAYPDSLNATYVKLINRYITVSESTKQNLIQNFGIPAQKISMVPAFITVKESPPLMDAELINKELKINNAFIIGASGASTWRKGADIFVRLAAIVNGQIKGKVKFVWVGEIKQQFKYQLEHELKQAGLDEEAIIFTGPVDNPLDYFKAFDVFVLPSREDPFPLVCLEAASVGKPVICFDKAGGMTEFLQPGGGIIVPYGNLQAMADAVMSLYNNRDRLNTLGAQAKAIVQQYDVAVKAPEILNIIDSMIIKK